MPANTAVKKTKEDKNFQTLCSLANLNKANITFKGKRKEAVNAAEIIKPKLSEQEFNILQRFKTIEELQKAYDENKAIDKKDLLSFLNKINYDGGILCELQEEENFENALIISHLLDRGVLKEEDLCEDSGKKENRFIYTIKDFNFSNTIVEYLDGNISFDDADSGLIKLCALGASIKALMKNADKFDYNKIAEGLDKSYAVSTNCLQGKAGHEIVCSKSKNDYKNKKIKIYNKTYRSDGLNTKSVSEIDMPRIEKGKYGLCSLNGVRTNIGYDADSRYVFGISNQKCWTINGHDTDAIVSEPFSTFYEGENRTFDGQYLHSSSLNYMLEIIKDEKGSPIKAIYKTNSEFLDGVYEVLEYNLPKGIQEDEAKMLIKAEKLKPASSNKILKTPLGDILFEENLSANAFNTTRKYKKELNKDGSLRSADYSYSIKDKSGNNIFNLNRSFEKSEDKTITTINGKQYEAKFDEDNFVITILDEKNKKTEINIKDKVSFLNSEEQLKGFFDFLKDVPADALLNLDKHAGVIEITSASVSSIGQFRLEINPNLFVLAHELGHGRDLNYGPACEWVKAKDGYGRISGNKELLKIYNKEMREFKKRCPELLQNVITYFGQNGGSGLKSTGLLEFLAEANAIFTTPETEDSLSGRAHFLVQYFPETLSKIGDLLGYNAK